MREESQKAGAEMWSYLKVKFFENYAACAQAILARVDAICMRIAKLIERGNSKDTVKEVKEGGKKEGVQKQKEVPK